ncbi:ATP-binding protein [Sedimentibacter sp. zth1]|uniref:nucleotide-binding protein n=1 Tax=Sedimentibacter sp. zth1 TaxID=2816908 RepID=UPI001A91BAD1|nr:ATP-binding protein [Sedimentibacter sp. zth1]QSX04988.1 ATP-binding protein [Sedimentibacter sp. zth1]
MKNKLTIAVLSGKGGTGKTFVSVNLAASAKNATYLDCDVEEPNGHIFLKPVNIKTKEVFKTLPTFDKEKCIGCRKCIDFCRFNAIAFIKETPQVFNEICHSCGGCKFVCPVGAIGETTKCVGTIQSGTTNDINVVTGMLNLGEASGVKVISEVLKNSSDNNINIIDCPPGSACTVMESVQTADYCVLVVEPTIFGIHNFKMVYELVTLLGKPCGVVINKYTEEVNELTSFCSENNIEILTKIPYNKEIGQINAQGSLAYEKDKNTKNTFDNLLNKVIMEISK